MSLLSLVACGDAEPEDTAICDGEVWERGESPSELMYPGRDCNACHAEREDAPAFTVAGTVAYSRRNADDCFGAAGVTVEITDADGTLYTTESNEAGNFYLRDDIVPPYTARVLRDGRFLQMASEQTDPNCASCHAADSVAGRITAP